MEDERFTLNGAGRAIWDQLDGQRSLADVVAAIETEFAGAEDGAIERDVLGLVAELVARRMLVLTDCQSLQRGSRCLCSAGLSSSRS